MSERVCAVVVTYNRKELLRECLEALRGQTRKLDHILVVDNASTDGTEEVLKAEFPEVELLRLPENQGSAGGFHEGMKRAYGEGFDWLWLMDDDGKPLPDTLEQLLGCPEGDILMRGCVVLAKDEPGTLAFEYPGKGPEWITSFAELRTLYSRELVIRGFANLFNGVLVSKELVDRIGLPEKRFFIWGDEAEYFWRAKRKGVKVATVLSALFLHPKDRMLRRTLFFLGKRVSLPYSRDARRFDLIVRNQSYIYTRYISILKWLVRLVLYLIFFPQRSHSIVKSSFRGALGKFEEQKCEQRG